MPGSSVGRTADFDSVRRRFESYSGCHFKYNLRLAQSGSASALGAEGRGFKSLIGDQIQQEVSNVHRKQAIPAFH